MKIFSIQNKDHNSSARTGTIHTKHGDIQTPAFIPVGTQATVKSLSPHEVEQTGAQIVLANTYHLYLRPGHETIAKLGGLHEFMNWQKPIFTDSGGFQVFSLGSGKRKLKENIHRGKCGPEGLGKEVETLCEINEDGVMFKSHIDGSPHEFTPEKSIEIQENLGADIIVAFDECTFHPATHEYAKSAMERTHRWAKRCLEAKKDNTQILLGIVQGSVYEDLRKESAKTINKMGFPGYCIGGVSVGETKQEMKEVLEWVTPLLDEEKPRHLLGVGEIDDFFTGVENGMDTFDCVYPTRIARMGYVLVKDQKNNFQLNITSSKLALDKNPIEKNCDCYTCQNFTRAYINHLFRAKELLAYRLATIHNVRFVIRLVDEIRQSIQENNVKKLKKEWLG